MASGANGSGEATYSMASGANGSGEALQNADAMYEMASAEAQAILDGVATYEIASGETDTYATADALEASFSAGDHYATTSVFDIGTSLRRASIDNNAYAVADAPPEPPGAMKSGFGRGLPSLGASIRSRSGSGTSLRRASVQPQQTTNVSRALSIAPVTAAQRRRHQHRLNSATEGHDGAAPDGFNSGRRGSGATAAFQFATMSRKPKKQMERIVSDSAAPFLEPPGARSPSGRSDASVITAWSPEASEDQTDSQDEEDRALAMPRLSKRRTSNLSIHSFAEV
jgi:hypothetical protein